VTDRLSKRYRYFADHEAVGRSPLYVELAEGVSGDPELLSWLDGLPQGKSQPNLLFAAERALCGTPSGYDEFRAVLAERRDEVEAIMLTHRTQTNEATRCALLLPVLARLPQPLALLEVGTSAGLCLLPDFYGYDYGGVQVGDGSPVLRCEPSGGVPLPMRVPEIAWRAGLDLNPVDIDDPEAVRWLELLIWPGLEYRLEVLHGALEVARRERPRVIEGDLRTDLAALAAEAPRDATLVIFHTAVLYYVPSAGRPAFRETIAGLGATWVACEAPHVLGLEPGAPDALALALDGRRVAWADGHGRWLRWG
jgi:hypothetical protein